MIPLSKVASNPMCIPFDVVVESLTRNACTVSLLYVVVPATCSLAPLSDVLPISTFNIILAPFVSTI